MPVVLKCYADEKRGDIVSVPNRHHPKGTPDPRPGERVFVWTVESPRRGSRHTAGAGLADRGSVIERRRRSDGQSGSEFRILIDTYSPVYQLNTAILKTIRGETSEVFQRILADRILSEALPGITGLDDLEANYLDSFYDPRLIDVSSIRRDPSANETTLQRLIDARLGQGQFRNDVLVRWQRRCVITGCSIEVILHASHIKPWRESTNSERLNPANGLLLIANLDALFDRYLISFDTSGHMLVSRTIGSVERELLGLPRNFRSDAVLGAEIRRFLLEHEQRFRRLESREGGHGSRAVNREALLE